MFNLVHFLEKRAKLAGKDQKKEKSAELSSPAQKINGFLPQTNLGVLSNIVGESDNNGGSLTKALTDTQNIKIPQPTHVNSSTPIENRAHNTSTSDEKHKDSVIEQAHISKIPTGRLAKPMSKMARNTGIEDSDGKLFVNCNDVELLNKLGFEIEPSEYLKLEKTSEQLDLYSYIEKIAEIPKEVARLIDTGKSFSGEYLKDMGYKLPKGYEVKGDLVCPIEKTEQSFQQDEKEENESSEKTATGNKSVDRIFNILKKATGQKREAILNQLKKALSKASGNNRAAVKEMVEFPELLTKEKLRRLMYPEQTVNGLHLNKNIGDTRLLGMYDVDQNFKKLNFTPQISSVDELEREMYLRKYPEAKHSIYEALVGADNTKQTKITPEAVFKPSNVLEEGAVDLSELPKDKSKVYRGTTGNTNALEAMHDLAAGVKPTNRGGKGLDIEQNLFDKLRNIFSKKWDSPEAARYFVSGDPAVAASYSAPANKYWKAVDKTDYFKGVKEDSSKSKWFDILGKEPREKTASEKNVMYHGSGIDGLSELAPSVSRVIDGNSAVFATPDRDVALSFLAPWRDDDFEHGSVDGQYYMREKYPEAFEKKFKNKSGTIYHLPADGFEHDPRLTKFERINKNKVKPLKAEKIENILEALQKSKFTLLKHKELAPWEKTALLENESSEKTANTQTEAEDDRPHHHLILRIEADDIPNSEKECDTLVKELAEEIGMKIVYGPKTKHLTNPETEGYSSFAIITTSHISLHTWNKTNPPLMQIDIFSCNAFSKNKVEKYLRKKLKINKISDVFIDRTSAVKVKEKTALLENESSEKTAAADPRQTILVTGHSGAGKSTLAKALAEKLNLPLHRVDAQTSWDDLRAHFEKNPKLERKALTPGTKENKKYIKDVRKIVHRSLQEINGPAILEGTQVTTLPAKQLAKYKANILVGGDVEQSIAQRLQRMTDKANKKGINFTPEELAKKREESQFVAGSWHPGMEKFKKLPGVLNYNHTEHQIEPLVTALKKILSKTAAAAWQRSEGKNPEGGLNAKGRASYKRETGGTLKAPVTESEPRGERAKRQNSFCSRMCGMKRVNTGSKAQSDPDSRINKSLRKWNCKCGEDHSSLFEKIACSVKEAATPPGSWTTPTGSWHRSDDSLVNPEGRVMNNTPNSQPMVENPYGDIAGNLGMNTLESLALKGAKKIDPINKDRMSVSLGNRFAATKLLKNIAKAVPGVSAASGISDTKDRLQKEDYTGAMISGLGAAGDAAQLAHHPLAKGIGLATSWGSTAANAARDINRYNNRPVEFRNTPPSIPQPSAPQNTPIQQPLQSLAKQSAADHPVNSSNIKAVGHDKKEKILEVAFHSGGEYRYKDVPRSLYSRLLKAKSPGKFLNKHIKKDNSFEYEKIAGIPEHIRKAIAAGDKNLLRAAQKKSVASRAANLAAKKKKIEIAELLGNTTPDIIETVQKTPSLQKHFPFVMTHELEQLKKRVDPTYKIDLLKYLGRADS